MLSGENGGRVALHLLRRSGLKCFLMWKSFSQMTQMTWLNQIMEPGNSDAWQSFRKSKAQILRAGFAIACLQLLAIWFWFFHAAAVVLLFGQPQSLLSFAFSLSQIWVVITAVAAVVPQSCFIIPESARRLYQMLKIIPWPCHLNALYDGWGGFSLGLEIARAFHYPQDGGLNPFKPVCSRRVST